MKEIIILFIHWFLILIWLSIIPISILIYNIRQIEFKETCIKEWWYMTSVQYNWLVCNKK